MDWKTRDSVYQLLGAVDIYFNGFWMGGEEKKEILRYFRDVAEIGRNVIFHS